MRKGNKEFNIDSYYQECDELVKKVNNHFVVDDVVSIQVFMRNMIVDCLENQEQYYQISEYLVRRIINTLNNCYNDDFNNESKYALIFLLDNCLDFVDEFKEDIYKLIIRIKEDLIIQEDDPRIFNKLNSEIKKDKDRLKELNIPNILN